MIAVTTSGTLYAWGRNQWGQLGLGNRTYYSSPKQIGALTTWAYPGGSEKSTICVKTDGTLWTWGSNSSYGLATTGGATVSPNQIGSDTDWASAAMGITFGACIKTTGTLWTWGRNTGGQLGLGDTTTRSSPTQVGSLSNWKIIVCSAQTATGSTVMQAIKTDGTLWGWGANTNSILGTGNGTSFSSPVQIGSDTDWANVWIGRAVGTAGGIGCATKTNGTFWVWGVNSYGTLGTGNETNYNSPVQLGGLTNWLNAKVSAGENQMTVVKSDGTLWTWGNSTYGRNGLGDLINRSSPTQIGALTTWVTTRTGSWGESNAAIKTP